MAAQADAPGREVVRLNRIRETGLDSVLEEEARAWRQELDWDFTPSADLVRRYLSLEALSGFALLEQGRAVGYAYYVAEEHKGLIGDLYVVEASRRGDAEALLLEAVVQALTADRYVRRIEAQLMLLEAPLERPLPAAHFLRRFERRLMAFETHQAPELPPRPDPDTVFDLWSERRQEDAARLIAEAYRHHVDADVNDQYRSPAGARRFLYNIVQYPGCGVFFAPASWVALERASGRLRGLCLASLVAADVGHITQVCVRPDSRRRGLGYELLRRSLCSLAQAGLRRVTLTVTSANQHAVALYQRMGFLTLRRFAALVWEGF